MTFADAKKEIATLGFNLKRGGDEEDDDLYFMVGITVIFADLSGGGRPTRAKCGSTTA